MFLSSFRSSEILFHEVILSVYLQTFVRHSIFIFQNANIYSYLIFKKKKTLVCLNHTDTSLCSLTFNLPFTITQFSAIYSQNLWTFGGAGYQWVPSQQIISFPYWSTYDIWQSSLLRLWHSCASIIFFLYRNYYYCYYYYSDAVNVCLKFGFSRLLSLSFLSTLNSFLYCWLCSIHSQVAFIWVQNLYM